MDRGRPPAHKLVRSYASRPWRNAYSWAGVRQALGKFWGRWRRWTSCGSRPIPGDGRRRPLYWWPLFLVGRHRVLRCAQRALEQRLGDGAAERVLLVTEVGKHRDRLASIYWDWPRGWYVLGLCVPALFEHCGRWIVANEPALPRRSFWAFRCKTLRALVAFIVGHELGHLDVGAQFFGYGLDFMLVDVRGSSTTPSEALADEYGIALARKMYPGEVEEWRIASWTGREAPCRIG